MPPAHGQVARIKAMSADMLATEKRLGLQLKADPQMQRIAQIPGVGLLTATAAIATMGEASAFKSGREFCAWLGLEQNKQRRPTNVVIVAQGAKTARTIWPVTAKEQDCQRGFQSVRPQAA